MTSVASRKSQRYEYLGALIRDERRLVLVPVQPSDPWEAFQRLRSWMKQSHNRVEIDLFESRAPIESEAKVIALDARRRRHA